MGYKGLTMRYNQATSGSSITGKPFLKNVAIGETMIIAIAAPSTTAEPTFSMSDSAGNVYTQRVNVGYSTPINSQLAIMTCKTTAAIVAGSTTWGAAASVRTPAGWAVLGAEFDNLAAGFDVSSGGSGTAGKDMASGATAAAAQNRELLFYACMFTDIGGTSTFTQPTGYTTVAKETMSLAAPKSLAIAWRQVDVSGTRSATGHEEPTNATWTAGIVAMKASLDPSGMSILTTGGHVLVEVKRL